MEYTSLPQALEALEKLQSTMAAYNHAMGVLSQGRYTILICFKQYDKI